MRFTDWVFKGYHAHHGRMKFLGMINGLGRYFNKHLVIVEILELLAQTVLVFGFGLRQLAFVHFFLQLIVHIDQI
ncbi:hypothetical protein, partial [Neisseria sp. P0015.S002]|uniref:hypothetical protein n=1 Tax=Neisseria sp. P0015.S002 TaxID=3436758 RepID=UPI003F81397F